jgi:hypothetical protein
MSQINFSSTRPKDKETIMKSSTTSLKDLFVVAFCVVTLVMMAGAVNHAERELRRRMICRRNLSGFAKAMLIYANDYEDKLPKAGGRTNQWVPALPDWKAPRRHKAYGFDTNPRRFEGKTTISSSLYLLVKYAELKPRQFVCPSDPNAREFKLEDLPETLPKGYKFIDAWDFGGRYSKLLNPSRHNSYAYHEPLDQYSLTTVHEPEMAVLADRNPWLDPKRVTDAVIGWTQFKPDMADTLDAHQRQCGNSDTHQREGQNVLFLDAHVDFEKKATCGVNGDNIYTMGSDKPKLDIAKGKIPKAYEIPRPLNRRDSVLIQDVSF